MRKQTDRGVHSTWTRTEKAQDLEAKTQKLTIIYAGQASEGRRQYHRRPQHRERECQNTEKGGWRPQEDAI